MISAFLSCSFSKEDHPVLTGFRSVLRDAGFDIVSAEPLRTVSVHPPAEKVRNEIMRCDCVIAIITPSPTEWIQNEIGMAYMARKPILLFRELGAELPRGIPATIGDVVPFTRDNIHALEKTVRMARVEIAHIVSYGDKMNWYGRAVHEIVFRLETAATVDIIGQSTISFYDAFSDGLRDITTRRAQERKKARRARGAKNAARSTRTRSAITDPLPGPKIRVYFLRTDDQSGGIRKSARRAIQKWRGAHPSTEFLVTPDVGIDLRAIVFDRGTPQEEGYIGQYVGSDDDAYLGGKQVMERFDASSVLSAFVRKQLAGARPLKR